MTMPYFYTIAIIAIITIFLSASHGFTHTTKTLQ
ncbi:MAG: hypothetical protein ACI90V_000797, partial [Bacillariaceae sp.]